jgi:hypothetical protein
MKKLSMMDKGFLFQESREMPMHVGSLNLYTLPDNADEQEFLHGLARNTRDAGPFARRSTARHSESRFAGDRPRAFHR